MASPGARKGHAGKWGELTPLATTGRERNDSSPLPTRVCVSKRNAIHFRVRGCPGLTGPQAPKRDGGEGGRGSKNPYFLSF